MEARIDPNSMLYWWPKIARLNIPMPKTIVVPVDINYYPAFDGDDVEGWDGFATKLKAAAAVMGYPLFMRGDQMSAKHQYKDSCHVTDADAILRHFWVLAEDHAMCDMMGRDMRAIFLRELLSLESPFTAFIGELPIAKERRYFVTGDEVVCWHFYWPTEAVARGGPNLPDGWEKMLDDLREVTAGENALLMRHAKAVGKVMGGYWSIDFAKATDGTWYLIDMARGECSWHPQCEENVRIVGEDAARRLEV